MMNGKQKMLWFALHGNKDKLLEMLKDEECSMVTADTLRTVAMDNKKMAIFLHKESGSDLDIVDILRRAKRAIKRRKDKPDLSTMSTVESQFMAIRKFGKMDRFRIAIQQDQLDLLKHMIEVIGTDASIKGDIAIREAARLGRYNIVKYLLSLPNVDPRARDCYAYRTARAKGFKDIVELLPAPEPPIEQPSSCKRKINPVIDDMPVAKVIKLGA